MTLAWNFGMDSKDIAAIACGVFILLCALVVCLLRMYCPDLFNEQISQQIKVREERHDKPFQHSEHPFRNKVGLAKVPSKEIVEC